MRDDMLGTALIALLGLPDSSRDEEIIYAVMALKNTCDDLSTRLAQARAYKDDIEQQRLDALEILREAARMHFEYTDKTQTIKR